MMGRLAVLSILFFVISEQVFGIVFVCGNNGITGRARELDHLHDPRIRIRVGLNPAVRLVCAVFGRRADVSDFIVLYATLRTFECSHNTFNNELTALNLADSSQVVNVRCRDPIDHEPL